MTDTTALATRDEFEFDAQRTKVLQATVAKDLSPMEFGLFMEYVRRARLDPFRRQIYALKVDGQVSVHVGIDGLRLIAERSGEYEGQDGPWWCGDDGKWLDVWMDDAKPPKAAKVTIYRTGLRPISAIAKFAEYAQTTIDKQTRKRVLRRMWQQFPTVMLAKCAEAVAIRRAFPSETSGLYVAMDEETGEVSETPRVVQREAAASNYQVGELHRLAKALGWSDHERHARAGVGSFRDLRRGPASDLIDEWTRIHDEAVAAEAAIDAELVEDSGGGGEGEPPAETPSEAAPMDSDETSATATPERSSVADAISADDERGAGSGGPSPDPAPAPIDRDEVERRLIVHFKSRPRLWEAASKRFADTRPSSLRAIPDEDLAAWLADVVGGKDGGS